MSGVLLERDQRYRVVVEARCSENGATPTSYRADSGLLLQGADPAGPSFLVVLPECGSVQLGLGENGLMLQRVRLTAADRAVISATVYAGPDAPEWLPAESTYLLFDGDRTAAVGVGETYIPFEGLLNEPGSAGNATTTLEQLAIAVGRSIARANAVLSQTAAPAGVGLVSGLTIQLAVSQAEVRQGRLQLAGVVPSGPGQAPTQYVQLTLTTVPGAETATVTAAPVTGQGTTTPAAAPAAVATASAGQGATGAGAGAGAIPPTPPIRATVRRTAGKSCPVRVGPSVGANGRTVGKK